MDRFYHLCLQGNVTEAMEYLTVIHPKTEEMTRIEECMKNRFLTSEYQLEQSFGDSWIDQIIFYYHQYLRTVLLNPLKKDEAEETLKQNLGHVLKE